jgi:hypothetical protein
MRDRRTAAWAKRRSPRQGARVRRRPGPGDPAGGGRPRPQPRARRRHRAGDPRPGDGRPFPHGGTRDRRPGGRPRVDAGRRRRPPFRVMRGPLASHRAGAARRKPPSARRAAPLPGRRAARAPCAQTARFDHRSSESISRRLVRSGRSPSRSCSPGAASPSRVPRKRSILPVVEEAGVLVLSSCNEGTCETPVLEGEPDHRDSVLPPRNSARTTA